LIGNDNNVSAEEHPSIKIIKENKKEIPKLIGSFRGEDVLDIDQSETRIACGGHVC
jgi:hypothetical protein